MSSALNGSSALQCFERGNVVKIHNWLMFDFYPWLPRVSKLYVVVATWHQLNVLPVDGFRGVDSFPEVMSVLAFALIASTCALISPVWCNRTLCMFVNSQQLLNFSCNFFSALFRKAFRSVKIKCHIQGWPDQSQQYSSIVFDNVLWGKAWPSWLQIGMYREQYSYNDLLAWVWVNFMLLVWHWRLKKRIS